LDPVAEHAIEADAQARDAGPRALALLQPGDPRARLARFGDQRAEALVPALADQPAIVQRERRLVDESLGEQRADLRERRDLTASGVEQRDRHQARARRPDVVERLETRAQA